MERNDTTRKCSAVQCSAVQLHNHLVWPVPCVQVQGVLEWRQMLFPRKEGGLLVGGLLVRGLLVGGLLVGGLLVGGLLVGGLLVGRRVASREGCLPPCR
jgi:hypothetical protein